VVIIADADDPGRRGAESLAVALLPYVPSLKVVEPPAPFKDLRSWQQASATPEDVHRLIAGVEPRRLVVKVRTA